MAAISDKKAVKVKSKGSITCKAYQFGSDSSLSISTLCGKTIVLLLFVGGCTIKKLGTTITIFIN